MEKQLKLLDENSKDREKREEKLKNLFDSFSKKLKYNKIISYFGNVNSEVMILAEAPVLKHLKSNSSSIFCFDINSTEIETQRASGQILIKVFKDLNLDINNYFWDNVYKIPLDSIRYKKEKEEHEELLMKELEILNIKKIIVLGRTAESIVKKLNEKYDVKFCFHPAYLLRNNFYDYQDYIALWRTVT